MLFDFDNIHINYSSPCCSYLVVLFCELRRGSKWQISIIGKHKAGAALVLEGDEESSTKQ
jgi:hypothetical protein